VDLIVEFVQTYEKYKDLANVRTHSFVEFNSKKYPLASIQFGNPNAPALVIVGGVHGLERIGAQLAVSLLKSFYERLSWDKIAQDFLQHVQLVFVPLVNPIGYFEITRSNGQGIDLMRNAPIETEGKAPFLLGGHRYSNRLPWYRGESTAYETEFLLSVMKEVLSSSPTVISVDIHSGFGFRDQLWFPFAYSQKEFSQLAELSLFFELFEKSHPYHIYKIEPQSMNYMTHGDIWDYCYLQFKKPEQVYLPLTLEMGSWIWVKKNPLQIFSKAGLFNPMKQHRINRTMRRHRPLFDFLIHSLISHEVWSKYESHLHPQITLTAKKKYYDRSI
jgi:Zinc carboxypeptidase